MATAPKASGTCHPPQRFMPKHQACIYLWQLYAPFCPSHSQSLSPNPSPISIMPSEATISDNKCFNIFFSTVFFHHHQLKPTFSQRCAFPYFRLQWRLPFLSHTLRQEAGVGVRIHASPWCCFSILRKPHQSLCHLRLPFSVLCKH